MAADDKYLTISDTVYVAHDGDNFSDIEDAYRGAGQDKGKGIVIEGAIQGYGTEENNLKFRFPFNGYTASTEFDFAGAIPDARGFARALAHYTRISCTSANTWTWSDNHCVNGSSRVSQITSAQDPYQVPTYNAVSNWVTNNSMPRRVALDSNLSVCNGNLYQMVSTSNTISSYTYSTFCEAYLHSLGLYPGLVSTRQELFYYMAANLNYFPYGATTKYYLSTGPSLNSDGSFKLFSFNGNHYVDVPASGNVTVHMS